MDQNHLFLFGICIIISGLLCLICLILPVVIRAAERVGATNRNTVFLKLLLSVLAGDILNLSALILLDSLTLWATFLVENTWPIKWSIIFCMGIGYWSMVFGTIMIAWNRMWKFCITINFKPLQWFERPKPLICGTWILSTAVTLLQSSLVCYFDFDPGTLSFHRFCPKKIHLVILNAFGLLSLILIIPPYLFIIHEIIRLKKISNEVQPVVDFNAENHNVIIRRSNLYHVRSVRSGKAEVSVGAQVVLIVVILIITNTVLAFAGFGNEILDCILSQYAMIILCTHTSVLSLIFCDDISTATCIHEFLLAFFFMIKLSNEECRKDLCDIRQRVASMEQKLICRN